MPQGLDREKRYELRSLDSGQARELTGRELVETGLTIAIEEAPGSALFVYKRLAWCPLR